LRFYARNAGNYDGTTIAKKWRAKKWMFGLRLRVGDLFALRFFCQFFFEFVSTAFTTVNRRRLKPELQQSVARLAMYFSHGPVPQRAYRVSKGRLAHVSGWKA
jgi:hypothetical protein